LHVVVLMGFRANSTTSLIVGHPCYQGWTRPFIAVFTTLCGVPADACFGRRSAAGSRVVASVLASLLLQISNGLDVDKIVGRSYKLKIYSKNRYKIVGSKLFLTSNNCTQN